MSYLWQGSTHWNETFHRFASHLDVVATHEKRVIVLNLARGAVFVEGCSWEIFILKKIIRIGEFRKQ